MARRKTAQERRIDALLDQYEPQVRKAFLAAIQQQATAVDLGAVIAALEVQDIERAVQLLRGGQSALFPLTEAVRSSYIAGGASVAATLPVTIRGQFGFGGNPRAAATIERVTGKLAEILDAEQTEMARAVFRRGVMEGVPPRKQALDMVGRIAKGSKVRKGGYIGLDTQRAMQADKVREILSDPARVRDYFIKDRVTGKMKPRFTTTDRRFDATVRRAIAEGNTVPARALDKITSAHKSRLLKNRGETIARTETLGALSAGQHDGFTELVETGLVEGMTKKWLATSDNRTRDSHTHLNGMEVEFDELFDGIMLYPRDRGNGAGPGDLINCRCEVLYIAKKPEL